MNIHKRLLQSFLIAGLLTAAGCEQRDRINAYPEFTDLFPREMVRFPPVIVVGRILACVSVGSPRPSIWDGRTPFQEYRTTIAIENVLNGNVTTSTTDIYFLKNLRNSGLKELGTVQHGGSWRIGDREMFFLQRDSGRLRTVCDTFAHCVVPVLSGRHISLKRPADVGESITDILFTRGEGVSDAEMSKAFEHATFLGFRFAPSFAAKKLEEIVQNETPLVRKAACNYVRMWNQAAQDNDSRPVAVLAENPSFINAMRVCSAGSISP